MTIAGAAPTLIAETEPNDTAATADSFSVTSEPVAFISGGVNSAGDLDFFTFTAPAGSRVWIVADTGGPQNVGATSRDTVIDLLAADGTTVIETDDNDGTGNGGDGTVETELASMIGGRTLTAGGTYFIKVRAIATGVIKPYRLFVVVTTIAPTPEVEANDTAVTANLIAMSSPVGLRSGSIGVAGDADYYAVYARAGNIICFNVDADPERDGTGTDLLVELRSPDDTLLLSVNSSITGSIGDPAAEGANFSVETEGTYFIKVRAIGTGTYRIMGAAGSGPVGPVPTVTPEAEPNNTSATANAFSVTTQPVAIVSGTIDPGGDLDFFTFIARAGSRVWIEADTGGTPGANSRDSVIDLLAADGTTVIESDDDDGTGNGGDGTVESSLASIIGGRTLTAGGTYFIKVRAFAATTGVINPYRLFVVVTTIAPTSEVEANDTAATANPIVTDAGAVGLRAGSIGSAGDVDYYSIAVKVGNVIYFNVDCDPEHDGSGTDLVIELRHQADIFPEMLLLSVNSSFTGSLNDPAAEGANFTVTASGNYFIKVKHVSPTGTGTYNIMAAAGKSGAPLPVSPPTFMVATATTPTSVVVEWSPVGGDPLYEVVRAAAGTGFVSLGTFTGSPITDTTVAATTAYLYKVRIVSTEETEFTSPDLATTVIFTNPLLTPDASPVRAADFTELRTAVNAVRVLAGVGAAAFPDTLTAGSTPIKALHMQELRSALDPARSALSLSPIVYTHPTPSAGTSEISAADVTDLRNGVN